MMMAVVGSIPSLAVTVPLLQAARPPPRPCCTGCCSCRRKSNARITISAGIDVDTGDGEVERTSPTVFVECVCEEGGEALCEEGGEAFHGLSPPSLAVDYRITPSGEHSNPVIH